MIAHNVRRLSSWENVFEPLCTYTSLDKWGSLICLPLFLQQWRTAHAQIFICDFYLRRRLASGKGIVTLGIYVCVSVCVSVCPPSCDCTPHCRSRRRNNALYPVLSIVDSCRRSEYLDALRRCGHASSSDQLRSGIGP